ncbi:MAG: electron transfer flavoprotein subunit alpha/FixB family protein [Syntrophomonadaceae bacterium]|nr:electron transfer flavoprotein subunit alpha/FixB family protein [Syntrophomonadaceae bacterium]
MAGVWILAEHHNQVLELLGVGRDLATKQGTRLTALIWDDRERVQEYIDCGADEVLLLAPPASGQPPEAYVPVIVAEALTQDPDIFLIEATLRGKDMAARIAARLNTGLCSECGGLTLDEKEDRLVMERLIYGGAAVQTLVCSTRPQMATIPPRAFAPAQPQGTRQGQVRELPPPPPAAVRVIERKPKTRGTVSVAEAKVLVCVGRGIEKQEDLELARELAGVIGGELCCTRPIAEELHWLPEETYIGLSGLKVKPDLYIGVGISGQIQHMTGIRDARVICAINRDENAPIFEASDYGIVGDLYDVLPRLTGELKQALKK